MSQPDKLPKKYYVYIVRCADGTLYTGKAIDLEKRLLQHNGKLVDGAKYTRTRRPVKIVFYEDYETNSLASKREREIKQMNRTQKEQIISSRNVNLG